MKNLTAEEYEELVQLESANKTTEIGKVMPLGARGSWRYTSQERAFQATNYALHSWLYEKGLATKTSPLSSYFRHGFTVEGMSLAKYLAPRILAKL